MRNFPFAQNGRNNGNGGNGSSCGCSGASAQGGNARAANNTRTASDHARDNGNDATRGTMTASGVRHWVCSERQTGASTAFEQLSRIITDAVTAGISGADCSEGGDAHGSFYSETARTVARGCAIEYDGTGCLSGTAANQESTAVTVRRGGVYEVSFTASALTAATEGAIAVCRNGCPVPGLRAVIPVTATAQTVTVAGHLTVSLQSGDKLELRAQQRDVTLGNGVNATLSLRQINSRIHGC